MKRFSIWTVMLAVVTGLSTGAWAQHGGSVHAGGHDGRFESTNGSHTSDDATRGPGAPNFQTRLANNTNLANRLKPLLPTGVVDLQSAANGFKTRGQFIAALHAYRNLNISWDSLKSYMTTNHDSLGQAIHALRPDLDSKAVHSAVKTADREAKTDIEESNEPVETAETADTGNK